MHKWDEYISIKRIHRIQFRNNLRPYFPISKEILIFCCLHLSAAFLQFRWRERMEWNGMLQKQLQQQATCSFFTAQQINHFLAFWTPPLPPPIQHTLPLTHSLAHPNSLCRKFIQKQRNIRQFFVHPLNRYHFLQLEPQNRRLWNDFEATFRIVTKRWENK